jgi:protein-S-isoprenylcysteine O-methyltransferase Ste14
MPVMSDGKRKAGKLWLGAGLLLGGLLILFGSSGSCASDTQPHPLGWPFGVAPRSWTNVLTLVGVAGTGLALAGVVMLLLAWKGGAKGL